MGEKQWQMNPDLDVPPHKKWQMQGNVLLRDISLENTVLYLNKKIIMLITTNKQAPSNVSYIMNYLILFCHL
jgi:hypothetical protein